MFAVPHRMERHLRPRRVETCELSVFPPLSGCIFRRANDKCDHLAPCTVSHCLPLPHMHIAPSFLRSWRSGCVDMKQPRIRADRRMMRSIRMCKAVAAHIDQFLFGIWSVGQRKQKEAAPKAGTGARRTEHAMRSATVMATTIACRTQRAKTAAVGRACPSRGHMRYRGLVRNPASAATLRQRVPHAFGSRSLGLAARGRVSGHHLPYPRARCARARLRSLSNGPIVRARGAGAPTSTPAWLGAAPQPR